MKKTLNTLAAALLLGTTAVAPLAYAQDATTPAPATPTAPAPDATGSAPSTNTMAPTDSTAAATGSYLTQQSTTQISANDFIGQSVYTSGNESIGDINDLILEDKGGIVAAVVGVGGFLGIGEKDVAIPFNKLTVTHDTAKNEVRLTTTETAESLKAAPEFKSLDRTTTSSTVDQ
ncbi:PRC-barrel domain-containing protein [Rhizobium cremeum]|uniref:PRC-barrel domain-containing protein n=1 Tax=Rhizobium cremeum TaxID=2813827 RepID=UPI000DE03351|nr:PRC-barrel domain-containing protein [Rhizobium cremeum]MCJ7996940.1 PRC-barrel domain-containing protein [Rhizobium cremeum]MCJ8002158.1 PRC-barrel domain-containing protein [Rhizobium cremeum]